MTTPTVDVPGAAQLLKVHPKTVEDLIRDCELPAAKVGRAYVLMTKDVLAYIERSIIQQTAARMKKPATKASRPGRSRAGSRTASSSDVTCAP
jgi:excisionase family DNA binding protein